MIQTFVVYGYQLGGPGRWNFINFEPHDELRVPWYDERNPTHDFPERALAEITGMTATTTASRRMRSDREAALPFVIDEAAELSPPGWTREASAPPLSADLLSPTFAANTFDQPTSSRFVLFIGDSAEEVDSTASYDEDENYGDEPRLWDPRIDWDSLLWAALAELGLAAPGMPDWFWYRSGTP